MNLLILLMAIAEVESGNNDKAIGPAGEVSRYQMTKTVWRQYAPASFDWRNRDNAEWIAVKHANWIRVRLPKDLENDPAAIAACWNVGVEAFKRCGYDVNRLPLSARDYVERVMNVYEDELRKENHGRHN